MARPGTLKDIVVKFLKDNPGIKNRTAAKQLAAMYPGTFTVESARAMARSIRGVNNHSNRCIQPDTELADEWRNIRTTLPTPIPYNYSPVQPECEKALIISDAQVPFHDERAIEAAVKKGREEKVDLVIVDGDWWDCMEFSVFERNPALRGLTEECFSARQTFAYLRNEFPEAEIWYKVGNHEERLPKHFSKNMLGTIQLLEKTGRLPKSIASVGGMLDLHDFGVKMVEDRRPILLGKYLYIMHGHEGGGTYAPVLPARAVALKARVCAVVGHWHRTSTYVERAMDGRELVCYSLGCLCDLTPKWMPQNQWNHGFGLATIEKDGGFRMHNYRISKRGEVWA